MALTGYYHMLPCNCPPDWGTRERCHRCNQFHLRPGFCQAVHNPALDVSTPPSVDKNVDKDKDVDKDVDKDEERKKYKAEWMRKKRMGL